MKIIDIMNEFQDERINKIELTDKIYHLGIKAYRVGNIIRIDVEELIGDDEK